LLRLLGFLPPPLPPPPPPPLPSPPHPLRRSQDETNLYMIMEYCPGGDFMALLMKEDTLRCKTRAVPAKRGTPPPFLPASPAHPLYPLTPRGAPRPSLTSRGLPAADLVDRFAVIPFFHHDSLYHFLLYSFIIYSKS
jgi:hypothetical protein